MALAWAGCDFQKDPDAGPTTLPVSRFVTIKVEYRQPAGCMNSDPVHCDDRVVFFGSWMKPRSTTYAGDSGSMTIRPNGSVETVRYKGGPDLSIPDWSPAGEYVDHVVAYLESFGIDPCQATSRVTAEAGESSSGDGGVMTTGSARIVHLDRAIDGISVRDSKAEAQPANLSTL